MEQKKKHRKGIIAVPTSSHFYLIKKFALDLMELRLVFDKIYPDNSFIFSEFAWIEDARNIIWQRAKKFNPDWILWIDSDMTFTPKMGLQLVNYINQGYDFVTGLYYAGAQPHLPLIYKEIDSDIGKTIAYYTDHPNLKKDFFEIAGCGFGFCAISKKILEQLNDFPFKRLPSWSGEQLEENNLGEDLSFCRQAKDAGFKIYADITIQPGHIRTCQVDKEFLQEDRFYKMV